MQNQVKDNTSNSQFEIEIDGETAVAAYALTENTLELTHTQVPASARGRGIGQVLARAALDSARERNLKVVPSCSFMAGFIQENPEYQALLKDRNK